MMKHGLITRIIALSLVACLLFLNGCTGNETGMEDATDNDMDYVTRGEWLFMLADGFGLDAHQSNTPYYSDIDMGNDLFSAVQSLAEWGILSIYASDTLAPSNRVTYEEVASTAAIAAGFRYDRNGDLNIEDSVAYAVECGIVESGENLSQYMTLPECEAALEAARHTYLNPPTEEKTSVVFSDELIDLTGISVDEIQMIDNTLIFPDSLVDGITQDGSGNLTAYINTGVETVEIQIGDTFITAPTAEHLTGTAYKVSDIEEADSGIIFTTEIPTVADLYNELVIHTTVQAAADNIIWADGVTELPVMADQMSANGQSGEFRIELLSANAQNAYDLAQTDAAYKSSASFSWGSGAKKLTDVMYSDALGNGDAREALENSDFVYTDIPGISDFTLGNQVQSWEKALEAYDKYLPGYEITGTISIALNATVDVDYYKINILGNEIQMWPDLASLKIDSQISTDLKLEGKLEEALEIAKIPIPIGTTGLSVDCALFLYATASGAVEAKLELCNEEKVEWQSTAGFRHMPGENTAESEIQATGDLNAGAGVSASVCAFSVKIIGADIKAGADVEAVGSVVGKYEEQTDDSGVTTCNYTEAIKLSSAVYLPIVSLTVSGPEHLSNLLGLEKSWDIIGKETAHKFPIFEREYEFWNLTVIVGPDGKIIDQIGTAAGDISAPTAQTQSYETRFGEVNAVTYPSFIIDYPSNWTVTESQVTATDETVILTNERGTEIKFSYIGGIGNIGPNISGTSTALMLRVEATRVADANFVPTSVQGTDYSDLGKFVVAKLKTTGSLNMMTDADFKDEDGAVSYALLPESRLGIHETVRGPFEGEFAFWYSGYISLIAKSPDGQFTEQEEQEVIDILSSFRGSY